ncbi:uncharacterized protein LOC143233098 [Tachypleus tridentatus]|uniref:uncharacterized protein LOC143233098 n=1 Tax=Tachypleus tridentatus TaxID=6853 RepID=UPI003FD58BC4
MELPYGDQVIQHGRDEKEQVSSLTDEESPKHDMQLLDLISTKRDFSGPPDVTQSTAKWIHATSEDFHIDLTKNQESPITPAETVRWRDQVIEQSNRSKTDGESSLCIVSESGNSLYDPEEWRSKSFGSQSLVKIDDEDTCITSETPLMNSLARGEGSLQSFRLGHIMSTDV